MKIFHKIVQVIKWKEIKCLDASTSASHIIKISQRIQVVSGQPLDEEDSQHVFPSFVWLLRDVVLSLPKGVENLKAYFLEKVTVPQKFRTCRWWMERNCISPNW